MKFQVPERLRRSVTTLIEAVATRRDFFSELALDDHESRVFRDSGIFGDIFHFAYQFRRFAGLSAQGLQQHVAVFRDHDLQNSASPILVQVPDFNNFTESYLRFLNALEQAEVAIYPVAPDEAKGIFADRVSEFLAVGYLREPNLPQPTIVNSKRHGDTVIYCKGYFVSTATAFGRSTPATSILSPGRYCFGILDNGVHRFQDIVWTCPSTVELDLP